MLAKSCTHFNKFTRRLSEWQHLIIGFQFFVETTVDQTDVLLLDGQLAHANTRSVLCVDKQALCKRMGMLARLGGR